MYGNFFDLFDQMAGSWNRSVKERDGYTVKEAPNGTGLIILFNTLGVDKDDIKVTHCPVSQTKYANSYREDSQVTYLRVCGTTKIPETNDTFSVNYEIVCKNGKEVESVQYKVQNGLTIVYVKTKDEIIDGTPASQIENGGEFKW